MREIKFRAWVNGKGMFYFTIDELLRSTVYSDGVTLSGGNMIYVWEKGNKMQYTGLKDKNGVEIYEGDIVEFEPDSVHAKDGTIRRREVKCNEMWNGVSPFNCSFWSKDSIEVIGNIHENPELLT